MRSDWASTRRPWQRYARLLMHRGRKGRPCGRAAPGASPDAHAALPGGAERSCGDAASRRHWRSGAGSPQTALAGDVADSGPVDASATAGVDAAPGDMAQHAGGPLSCRRARPRAQISAQMLHRGVHTSNACTTTWRNSLRCVVRPSRATREIAVAPKTEGIAACDRQLPREAWRSCFVFDRAPFCSMLGRERCDCSLLVYHTPPQLSERWGSLPLNCVSYGCRGCAVTVSRHDSYAGARHGS